MKTIKVKTLGEKNMEDSRRNEKIEQLTRDLIVNPDWKIIEKEGDYYAVDMYGQEHLINVELRDKFPNSYFHSLECDSSIIGYDSSNGSIIYNLWTAGKIEIEVSEAIFPDFQDTAYGVGRLLRFIEECDFDGKVPPRHILPPEFIYYQNDLQDCMNYWGYEIPLIKADISETEQRQLHLGSQIYSYKRLLENTTNKSDDFINTYQKILESVIKEFDELGEEKYADIIKTHHERTYTLEEQMENYYEQKEEIELLSKELLNPAWSIIELYGEYYATDDFCSEFKINYELRHKLPNSFFYPPECDDYIIGYDAQSGAIIYNLWKSGRRVRNCVEVTHPTYNDTLYAIGHLLYQHEESGLDCKVPPINIFPPDFINSTCGLPSSICKSKNGLLLLDYNGVKDHYQMAIKESIDFFQSVMEDDKDQKSELVQRNIQEQLKQLTNLYESLA